MSKQIEVSETQRWFSDVVIGLNLCPFARKVFDADTIRYVVSEATDTKCLLAELTEESDLLKSSSPADVETTFLIHPKVLCNFFDYNNFLDVSDRMFRKSGRDKHIQLASFHPDYEFSETPSGDVANYSNRSPFPMLHLLRVESVAKVTGNKIEMQAIVERNINTLENLGIAAMEKLRRGTGTP